MTATLNGRLCTSVSLAMPRYGNWSARVTLGDADVLPTAPGVLSLTVAGITALATVDEQGVRSGQLSADIVGGYGGWSRGVPPLPHGLTANGVKLSTYAGTLAKAAGERLSIAASLDRPLGTVVARLGQQGAGELLSEVCASPPGSPVIPWWMGLDGVTHLGARTGTDSDPAFTDAEELDRWRVYTVDDATALLPGNSIAGRTIEEMRIEASGNDVSVRVVLGTPGALPQTLAATLRRFVLGLIGPRVSARTLYRYKVREVYDATRVRAVPVRAVLAPDLPSLRIWPGIPGGRGRPQVGSEIVVQFADGDPGFPICVGFAPGLDGTLGYPETAELWANEVLLAGTIPVARVGDIAGRLIFDVSALPVPLLYYSPSGNLGLAPYVPVALNPNTPNPPLPGNLGTEIKIATGSDIVKAG